MRWLDGKLPVPKVICYETDIALCYRSLKHNVDGTFGNKIYPDVNPNLLLEELGIEPNNEKIRYYILLDELF